MVGVLVRVEANAVDGGGQQAHLPGDVPAGASSDPGPSRAATTMTTGPDAERGHLARGRYWRALAASPLDEPIPAREASATRGLTGLGELARSRRP